MAVNIGDGSLKWVAEVDFQNLTKDVEAIKSKLTGITTAVNKESSAVEGLFKRTVASIAAYATFTAGANLIQNIVQVRGEFQQLEVAFTTMLQSKIKADKLLKEITEFAATTPFELKDVAKATKQLLAFGIGADDVKDTLKSLGDVSAGIGAPLGEIAYLFGTIKTQGVAMTQDVRQFAQRGIPIYEELAKVLGVSVEKVGELITAGKVGFPQIQAVFKNLTAEGSKFGGLMEEQSKTLLGLQSNLRDAIDQMFNDLGKSSEGIFATIIKTATSLVKNYEKVVDVIQILVITYGAYRAALILTSIAEQVSIVRKAALVTTGKALTAMQLLQTAATATLTRVTKLLNLAMLANPYVAITTLVVGLVSAMALLTDSTTTQEKAQRSLNESNEKYQEDIENLKSKTSDLVGIISNETNTRFQQVEAFQKLKTLYPDLLRNTDLMNFKTLSAEDAQKKFNQAIDENNIKDLRDQYKVAQVEVDRLTKSLKDARDSNLPGNTIPAIGESLEFAVEKARLLNEQIKQQEQNLFDANTPIIEQIKHYEKIKEGLLNQRDEIERNITKLKEAGATALDFRVLMASVSLDNLNKDLDVVQDKLSSFTNNIQAVKDKSFFTAQKTNAQQVIDALVISDVDFNKKKAEQVEIIRKAEKELEKYDTTVSRNTRSTKDNSKAQAEINSLLNERAGLIKRIDDKVKASLDFGKTDQQKELDKINEGYDDLILNIDTYNKKIVEQNKIIEAHNRKNPDKPVQKVGQLEVLKINQTRANELTNVFLREDAEKFKENLDKKQLLYEQYEEAKRQVGIDKANELFAEETKDFKSFLNVLRQQAILLAPKFLLGVENEGDKLKLKSIFDLMSVLNKKIADEQIERAKADFSELLKTVDDFNQQKKAIDEKYTRLELALDKDTTIEAAAHRKKILEQERKDKLQALEDEKQKRISTIVVDIDDRGVVKKFEEIIDSVNELQKDQTKEDISRQEKNFADLFIATEEFNDKRAALNQSFIEQQAAIEKDITIKNKDEELKILSQKIKEQLAVFEKQQEDIFINISAGVSNLGELENLKTVFENIKKLQDELSDKDFKKQKDNFSALLTANIKFNKEKAAINEKYDKLEADAEKDSSIKDKEEVKKRLAEQKKQELAELKNHIIRQSALYKKLSLDIIGYTRKQLKQLIKELENVLKLDKTLTPQMKADVQGAIDQYKSLLNETNETSKNFQKVAEGLSVTSNVFGQLADSVSEFDQSLGSVLQQISDVAKIGEDAANAFVAFSTGDVAGGITSAANAIQGIIEGFAKAAKSARDAKQAIIDFQTNILAGEAEYDLLIRERQRNEVKAHKLKLQGLEDEKKLLEEQRKLSLQAYDDVLKKLQSESFISGQKTKKKRGSPLTGILGFFSGTRTEVQNELSSLAGKTFEELEKLFTSGQLTDSAKALFEQLQKIKAEGVDIDRLLEENKLQAQQIFTGTTAESISDSIIQGLEEGKRGVADFADNFEDLMKQAFLNSLKFKYLEGPIQSFFEDFAAASESDGQLTSGEIDRLKAMYNSIITNAADQFEQLQQVAGINFNTGSDDRNTLTGAIRGMTEQQADLLAGQFGGLRITAIEQLRVAMRGIETLQNIEGNTARLIPMYDLWRRIELNGIKVI